MISGYFIFYLELIVALRGVDSAIKPLSTGPYLSPVPPGVTKNPGQYSSGKSRYKDAFNDKMWSKQWYAHDYRTAEGPVMDHNIVPVYYMGITGKGVKIVVLADNVQTDHPDIGNELTDVIFNKNYKKEKNEKKEGKGYESNDGKEQKKKGKVINPDSSKDECEYLLNPIDDHDEPKEEGKKEKKDKKKFMVNGAQATGIIGMKINNTMCGAGIARGIEEFYHVQLAWEATRADVLSGLEQKQDADIYQIVWTGSGDGGDTIKDSMNAVKQIREMAIDGRNKKGSIIVVDVGSGKKNQDNCAMDSLVNSVHVVSVAAANQRGHATSYSERCAGIMATAYSGDFSLEGVVTTDLGSVCRSDAKGTGIAASIATGIIALTLSANPQLTYRDMQHLISMTAEVAPLAENPFSWRKNAAGFWHSYDFGFGLLNAENMVRLAAGWKSLPELHRCDLDFLESSELSPGISVTFKEKSDGCQHKKEENRVRYLEHVELIVNFNYLYRGALNIELTSPSKTTTTLLEPRPEDSTPSHLKKWRIKSLHTWGESPVGNWEVTTTVKRYQNGGLNELLNFLTHGMMVSISSGMWRIYHISKLKLVMHGTWERPSHYAETTPYRSQYSSFNVDPATLAH